MRDFYRGETDDVMGHHRRLYNRRRADNLARERRRAMNLTLKRATVVAVGVIVFAVLSGLVGLCL